MTTEPRKKPILADHSTIKKRINHCRTCPFYKIGLCLKCGCVMRLKVRLERSYCPVRKW